MPYRLSSRQSGLVLAGLTLLGSILISGYFIGNGGSADPSPAKRQVITMAPPATRLPPGGQMTVQAKKQGERAPFAVFHHPDGGRTESRKTGDRNTLRQDTFSSENALVEVRIFKVDSEARLRSGVFYDGRKNAVGSTKYVYGQDSSQPQVEELFNGKGQLVRRLFHPGALKDPDFANRMVAFSYPSNVKRPKEEEIGHPVQPIAPVTGDGQDFAPFPSADPLKKL